MHSRQALCWPHQELLHWGKTQAQRKLHFDISFFQRATTQYTAYDLTCQKGVANVVQDFPLLCLYGCNNSIRLSGVLTLSINTFFNHPIRKKMLVGTNIWVYDDLSYLAIIGNVCGFHNFHITNTTALNICIYNFRLQVSR